jgi:hypothetical protein
VQLKLYLLPASDDSQETSVNLRKLMSNMLLEVVSSSLDLAAGVVEAGDEVREGKQDLLFLIHGLKTYC